MRGPVRLAVAGRFRAADPGSDGDAGARADVHLEPQPHAECDARLDTRGDGHAEPDSRTHRLADARHHAATEPDGAAYRHAPTHAAANRNAPADGHARADTPAERATERPRAARLPDRE